MQSRNKPRQKDYPPMIAKDGGQLMEFLLKNMSGKNKNNIKTLLNNRQILVNGMVVGFYNYQLQPGDEVVVQKYKASNEINFIGMTIVFEDDYLIVVDKHAGMACTSSGNGPKSVASILRRYVKRQNPANEIFSALILDREVSGLSVFAKSKQVRDSVIKEFTAKNYTYLAVIENNTQFSSKELKSFVYEDAKTHKSISSQDENGGKLAITNCEITKSNNHFLMLKINQQTNIRNQIRAQIAEIGNPIIGDIRYGSTTNPVDRLGLHAWTLTLNHPKTGKRMVFESHVPKKFLHLFDGKTDVKK